jgi:hypothetical protein
LSKQSHKTYRIATGKNKQEEERLKLKKKIIDKNYNFEDNRWVNEFIDIKKSLDDINLNTNCYYADQDQDEDFAFLKATLKSNKSSALLKFKPKSASQFNSRLNRPKSQAFSTSLDYYSIDPQNSLFSRNYLLLPGKMLKSYTSIVGAKFDRNRDQLASYSIKNNPFLNNFISNSRLDDLSRCLSGQSRGNSAKKVDLFSIEESLNQDIEYEINDGFFEGDDENDGLFKNDLSESNKSIRRGQIRSGSAKDILFQMRYLKSRAKSSIEKNRQKFNIEDRNVRYGGPLPTAGLYRELRILSKFETDI